MQAIPQQYAARPYRKDIDGLRAIAVLSVILFHLNPAWANGGFVGVDIFFVISGYLITGQIRKELADNVFTVKNFYLRRIRRIVPPLLAMLMVVSFAAWLILQPDDLESYVYSLVVQPLSLQNVFFWSEGDYFRGADTKALLHTWSLAVEEQFYLFWPLLLVLLKRVPFKPLFWSLCLVIAASFYLSVVVTSSEPQAAFFLIVTRAWELGFGGLAALLHEHLRSPHNTQYTIHNTQYTIHNTLGWLSIAALGYAISQINSGMPFPGKIALIPVLAAFFVVLSGGFAQTVVSNILSHRILVNIGLISYPLYLWHWPILVFMHYLHIEPTSPFPMAFFWIATFAFAYASYKWLEIPIRRKVWLTSPRSLLTAVTVSFVALLAFGLHVEATDGASYRFGEQTKAFLTARIHSYTKRCDVSVRMLDPTSPICKHHEESTAQSRILLWGNSHASMLIPMLEQLAEQHKASFYINVRNCRPLVEPNACNADVNTKILEKIQEKAINNVIFAASWGGLDSPKLEQQLTKIVGNLTQQNIAVWLVVDSPSGSELDPINALAKNPNHPQIGYISLAVYNEGSRLRELALFQRLQSRFANVHIIDTSPVFCNQDSCFGGKGHDVWYRDAGHLNNAGTQAISNYFLPVFQP